MWWEMMGASLHPTPIPLEEGKSGLEPHDFHSLLQCPIFVFSCKLKPFLSLISSFFMAPQLFSPNPSSSVCIVHVEKHR